MQRLLALPFLLLLSGIACAAMILPAAYALALEEFHDARSFFYPAVVGLVVLGMIAVAVGTRPHQQSAFRQLLSLLAAFALLPVLLAVPFYEAVRNTSFVNAYFEMVSSLTTTGATLFEPQRLSGPEHLWRGLVGWLGGLLIWVSAAAILAPMTLGGFEVTAASAPGQNSGARPAQDRASDAARRLARTAHALVPVYAGLTLIAWLALLVAGDVPLVALIHAMSILSTSGISSVGGMGGTQSGMGGEVILFGFMIFALSRLTFSGDTGLADRRQLIHDPELRLGFALVALVPAILFLRHFVASFDVGDEQNLAAALRALWGAVFTTLSFLTTTGFVSVDWTAAQNWSGLGTPGLILMALALIGGGVATTAGGVKLLRVFLLYLNGARELQRLVHPSSIGRSGLVPAQVRREGAFIAWVFFMLFALVLAATTLGLTALNVSFDSALILAIATLTNAGPLVTIANDAPLNIVALAPQTKVFLCLAMVLGRLEMLALIVILTPELWSE